tara:strand:- start:3931 stop:4581 length:651 start_codon:yes stop_codon:yes gene_type:complete
MNEIINKLKELCTFEVNLPSLEAPVKVEKLNINFQNKLQDELNEVNGENEAALRYLRFINKHIQSYSSQSLNFFDKIKLLGEWYNNIKNIDEKLKFDVSDIKDQTFNFNSSTLMSVNYYIPSLEKEATLLNFLLNREKVADIDIVYFDNFRFIKEIKFGEDQLYNISEMEPSFSYDVFLMFDTTIINNISNHISSNLESINDLRELEGDFTFYTSI